jgi:hypothetical protein
VPTLEICKKEITQSGKKNLKTKKNSARARIQTLLARFFMAVFFLILVNSSN